MLQFNSMAKSMPKAYTVAVGILKILRRISELGATQGSITVNPDRPVHCTVTSTNGVQQPEKLLELIFTCLGYICANRSGSVTDFEIHFDLTELTEAEANTDN